MKTLWTRKTKQQEIILKQNWIERSDIFWYIKEVWEESSKPCSVEEVEDILSKYKTITYKEIDRIKEENEKWYSAFEALVERLEEEWIIAE